MPIDIPFPTREVFEPIPSALAQGEMHIALVQPPTGLPTNQKGVVIPCFGEIEYSVVRSFPSDRVTWYIAEIDDVTKATAELIADTPVPARNEILARFLVNAIIGGCDCPDCTARRTSETTPQ